jgi:flagellin-like hook-associated protein FlgL
MANGIVLTNAIRQNLLSLQNTGELQGKIQERLATGKKVNSALDGPTNFFTAAGLNRRAGDLSTLLDGMMMGIKTLESADLGMKGIIQTVETMRAYTRQARQDKSFKGVSYTLDNASVGTAALKTLSISGGAVGVSPITINLNTADTGGTRTTVQTSGAYAPPATAAVATYTAQNVYAAPGGSEALTISFNGGSVDTSVEAADATIGAAITRINNAIAADPDANGKIIAYDNGTGRLAIRSLTNTDGNISVTGAGEPAIFATQTTTAGSDGITTFMVNGQPVTLTTAQSTVGLAVDKANADLGPTSLFEAFNNGGNLQFRAKNNGATAVSITGTDSGLFGAATLGTPPITAGAVKTVDQLVSEINTNALLTNKVKASNDGGKLHIDNISTEALTVVGASASAVTGLGGDGYTQTIGGNEVRKSLISQFNELRQQLDRLADDASYNGVNLLKGDKLKLSFNEVSTSILEIQAKDSSGVVRPINTSAISLNIVTATADEFSDDVTLEARIEALGDALTELQTQASSFGSSLSTVQTRQQFTKGMINTLEVGADNLTLADSNEEGANLLALNTRQQLAQTTLSLAAQAQQAVLRLFG